MSVEIKILSKDGITLRTKKKYVEEDIRITFDQNLIEGNNTDLSDSTANQDDLLLGKVAYGKDGKIEGTIETYDYSNSRGFIHSDEYLQYINGTFGETYYAPEGASRIQPYAFYTNNVLKKLVCSSTVKSLGAWCCRDCHTLTEVILNDGLEEISYYAFYNCTGLTKVTLPDTLKTFGTYIFHGCSNLVEVNVPNGISTIANYMFHGCINLLTLELPESIKNINNYSLVFGKDGNATLIMKATIPPTITSLAFGDGIGKIIVPKNCLSKYQTATNWSTKSDIMEEEE